MANTTPISDMEAAVSELLELARTEKDHAAALAFLLGHLEQSDKYDTATARTLGTAAAATTQFLQEQAARRAATRKGEPVSATYGMPTMKPVENLSCGDRLYPEKDGKALPAAVIIGIVLTPIDKHYRVDVMGGEYFVYRPGTQVFSARKH